MSKYFVYVFLRYFKNFMHVENRVDLKNETKHRANIGG